jgi:hypothetical protein
MISDRELDIQGYFTKQCALIGGCMLVEYILRNGDGVHYASLKFVGYRCSSTMLAETAGRITLL